MEGITMQKIKNSFQHFLQVLKPMSWKERLDHIFTYYKPALVGILAFVVLISIGVNAMQRKMNPPLYRGALVGVSINTSGNTFLTEELKTYLGASESKRTVVLRNISIADKDNPQASVDEQNAYYQLSTLIGGQELEYALLDQDAWKILGSVIFFADLREILPQEQLQQFENQLQWVEDNQIGANVPIGIDVTDLPGIKEIATENTRIYLAFPGNTENTSFNTEFLKYISQ